VQGFDLTADVVVVGVDNNPTRVCAARYFRTCGVPVIFTAVSKTANNGYVFVQEPNGPCFGCLFPDALNDESYPCPGTPAIKDILKVVAGLVLYALDSVLMARPRQWNYKDIVLDGSIPGNDWRIAARAECPICAPLPPGAGHG
jgi:molybdopterin/thiamine biosynthesis adenylyltransferase